MNLKIYSITIFFLVLSLHVAAQTTTYGDFKVADQEIIYQKILFSDSVTVEKLSTYYKTLPYISDVKVSGDEVTFEMNDITVDYKKFQFTQVATPPIIQTGKYSASVVVAIKDGKYRITARSIQLTGDIGYKKITSKENLTNYACKNNGTYISQDWCKPNTLGLLHQAFTDKLQYINKEKKKDDGDW
jgi:hypothetical protein